MNDTENGGMTISSLLQTALIVSLAVPEIAFLILGVLKGTADPNFTYALVGAALVVLVVVLAANYFVRRGVQDRLSNLVDVCRNFAGGDRTARAVVNGDDEFARLAMSINSLLDSQNFGSGGAPSIAGGSGSDAAALQAQIEKLLQEVSAVGDGDLRVQAEVTPDTLGVLADSFNYMIEELAKVVGRVQATAVQVTNATRRILDRTSELTNASETQVAQISQTTQAVEELATFIQNVAHNARLSAEAAQDALRNANVGQDAVRQSIEGMMLIRENVQETSKKIKRLGERSNEISEIIRIIEDIADQTNLLALNAAIQSAMAGEHGRGFAVVADEIRLLAERSTESTKRIETLVKSIQGDTYEAVVAMEDSTQEVVKGSQLADDAGRALNSIYAAVERQAQMIEDIALAANEQAQVSENVAIAMGEISEITHQTNSGTQEASMSVSYLSELADQLRASVSTFRLPDQAHEMVDVYPGMDSGRPALPGGDSNQYYQQDMGMNNDWNQGFSPDFLPLPQAQEPENAGSYQFAFSNQQDFGSQPAFTPQFSGQAFGGQQGFSGQAYGTQQGFSGQAYGAQQNFNGQAPGGQQGFSGQAYG
ncbi:MAG TPA: methyl-accepting chemotaxis protein, partial [Ktedonobacteraceae bacterium]|nr:methyl-accepting chemotaxis protein [Ktedonobacteraceae bacterium]